MIITVYHYIRILTVQAANPPSFTVLNLKFMRMFDVGIQMPMHHSCRGLVRYYIRPTLWLYCEEVASYTRVYTMLYLHC